MLFLGGRPFWSQLTLVGIGSVGIGLLIWLSHQVGADGMTQPQETLHDIADWMVKVSVGALLGFAGGRAVARNGRSGGG